MGKSCPGSRSGATGRGTSGASSAPTAIAGSPRVKTVNAVHSMRPTDCVTCIFRCVIEPYTPSSAFGPDV
jgi:hypothetical protein